MVSILELIMQTKLNIFDTTPTQAEITCKRIMEACDGVKDNHKKRIVKSVKIKT